jgi:hypothetical protein
MDETYYVIYDKRDDVYLSRNDWGEGEVEVDEWSFPSNADHYEDEESAREAKAKYFEADELIIVKVDVTYEYEELG